MLRLFKTKAAQINNWILKIDMEDSDQVRVDELCLEFRQSISSIKKFGKTYKQ